MRSSWLDHQSGFTATLKKHPATKSNDRHLQFAIHHICIRVPCLRTQKRLWQATYDLESVSLPQSNRALVRTDNKIELHGAKISAASPLQRMGTHGPRNSAAGSGGRRHISAVRHVGASSALVGPQKVSA